MSNVDYFITSQRWKEDGRVMISICLKRRQRGGFAVKEQTSEQTHFLAALSSETFRQTGTSDQAERQFVHETLPSVSFLIKRVRVQPEQLCVLLRQQPRLLASAEWALLDCEEPCCQLWALDALFSNGHSQTQAH